MKLVALLCSDPTLSRLLTSLNQPDYWLQVASSRSLPALLAGLEPLGFAGAIILDGELQKRASQHIERQSLAAKASARVDVVSVTAAGLMGEYLYGQALAAQLRAIKWDARGAKAVILGATSEAVAIARELSSLGLAHLSLLAENRPAAEKLSSNLAATTSVTTGSFDSPYSMTLLEQSDLLIRLSDEAQVPGQVLGPHLTIIDLTPSPMSRLREQAMRVGARNFGLRDLQAYQLALMLRVVLEQDVSAEPFLTLLHSQAAF
jgi:shikimate 5-dehydrogenase